MLCGDPPEAEAAVSDDRILTQLGVELRRRRNAKGWTLEETARRSGLSTNFVGAIEHGKRNPSVLTLAGIARGFGVPLRDLFGVPETLSAGGMEAGWLYDTIDEPAQSISLEILRILANVKRAG